MVNGFAEVGRRIDIWRRGKARYFNPINLLHPIFIHDSLDINHSTDFEFSDDHTNFVDCNFNMRHGDQWGCRRC